ncbi:MAG: sensor histidine kinase [Aquabacterium sp.]|nr:sensor histidine kinase [Aquabacterium sp.]
MPPHAPPARLPQVLPRALCHALLALLCLLAAAGSWAAPPVQVLSQAWMLPLPPGQPAQDADWSRAQLVQLPDDWASSRPTLQGVVAYRMVLPAPPPGSGDRLYGLSVERACSVLAVWLNGQMVHDGGHFNEPVSRHCHRPQLVAVPAALLRTEGNVLELRIRGHALAEVSARQRAGGLSAVVFGPHAEMAARHERQLMFAIRLPEVLSGALVLMGSFMFVMGWFNRAQSYLAYFGALMVGWSLLLARLWAADLPVANAKAELALATLMAFITLAAVQFLMRYAGHRMRWLDVALPVQCLLMPATLLTLGPQRLHMASGVWFAALSAQALAAAVFYLAQARRQRSRQVWPMAALLGVVAVSLLVELIALGWHLDSRVLHVAQLLPALGFLALGLRLVQQYGRAFQTAEQNRAELEVRIREATAQIERNFAQLSELRVEQVTDRERKRIAADLHDDLGAKLLTIVHTSDNERISTLAREALEEMRLSVRGLTGKPVKLLDALGDWRAEVVLRLQQSGVQSEWSAPPDDEVPQTLSSRAYVQTTRILREAVSNIIKHSGASQCSVRCTIDNGDFQLVVQDNGRGIPTELDGRLDKGHGIASMKGRAKQLQGQCLVESGPGYGTVIRLTLPLEQHTTTQ